MHGIIPMPAPYQPTILRQGAEAIFGGQLDREQQERIEQAKREYNARILAERMVADEGAAGAITSPFTQMRQEIAERFTQDYTGASIVGFDRLIRGRSMPSFTNSIRLQAQQEAQAADPLCGINRLINAYPVAAIGALLLTAWAVTRSD